MNILVLCPMQSEYDNFKAALPKKTIHNYTVQKIGVGKVNAAASTALNLYRPDSLESFDLVAVVGYAAASSYYRQGDFIIPSKAIYHDAVCPAGVVEDLERIYDLEGTDDATILTGDSFVDSVLAKKLIAKHGDKVLFDMEATAVAQLTYDLEIPTVVMKLISDIPDADHSNLSSFEEFVNTHTNFKQFVSFLESLSD